MAVDLASAARLVSLAFVIYCMARYNAEDLPTKNIGQILRILTLLMLGKSKKALKLIEIRI